MKRRGRPAAEVVRRLVRYEHEAGKLYWLARPREFFNSDHQTNAWNARHAGKEAFTATTDKGYKVGRLFDKSYRAHHVAWAIFYGEWPKKQIDHENCNPSDNRICNLREATHAQNQHNKAVRKDNRSGFKGVGWSKQESKWRARIVINGVEKHLGFYEGPREAHLASQAASTKAHGEFSRMTR